MVHPVPGYPVSTPYGIRGQHWTACGWHTGTDIAAPQGADVVAARPGTVVFVNYGSSFGVQIAVRQNGTEDFYAHLARVDVNGGDWVEAGQLIGAVGSTGNSTGPHLHLESHTGHGWRCDWMTDPAVAINYRPTTDEGEDEMNEAQAQQLNTIAEKVANLEWAVNQIRKTDFPRVEADTDRLPDLHNKTAEVHWGVLDDPQGARHMIAAVQAQLRAIEAHLGMTPTVAADVEPPPR